MTILVPLLVAGAACAPGVPVPVAVTYEELFRSGVTFEVFLEAAEARRELWLKNWERSAVPEDIAERARTLGDWKLLVIAIDGCSDSVSTIPYLARLMEAAPNLALRIVHPDSGGRAIMESHRTPDGRAATPTVLLLDAAFEERGCFIERPTELQTWYLENGEMAQDERVRRKMEWYDEDVGRTTMDEVVGLREAAREGREACAAGS